MPRGGTRAPCGVGADPHRTESAAADGWDGELTFPQGCRSPDTLIFLTSLSSSPAAIQGSFQRLHVLPSNERSSALFRHIDVCETVGSFSVIFLSAAVLQVHTFRGPHWCEYCANFMWGLIAQGVKCAGNTRSPFFS